MNFRHLIFACIPLAALSLAGCDVDVQDPGKAPDVDADVHVEPGRAPDIDVTPPDVDVHTEEHTIKVPDVDVDVSSEETKVKTPNIDINVPNENDNEPPGDAP
jgi:hypothetical protein